jgi:exonuclease SbcC
MIIHSIELENFGRLGHLKAELKGNIIGVEGPSGRGKSTLLQALQFAITGQLLDDTMASYMRDGGKHGKTIVRMRFSQAGLSGTIERSITKTTSGRKLLLDGQDAPLTTAKEVDQRMLSLMGADPRAVSGCVFVPQGQIYSVLFGDLTEREDRFTKMLGLSHFSSIQRAITASYNAIASTVTDMSGMKQANTEQLDQCIRDLSAAQAGLDNRPSSAELQVRIGDLSSKCARASAAGRLSHQLRTEWPSVDQARKSKAEAAARISTLQNWIASARASAAAKNAQRLSAQEWLRASAAEHKAKQDAAGARSKHQQAQASNAQLRQSLGQHASAGSIAAQLDKLSCELLALETYRGSKLQLEAAVRKLDLDRAAWVAAKSTHTELFQKANEVAKAAGAWESLWLDKLRMLRLRIDTLIKASNGASCVCPVCEQNLQGSKHTSDWLEELRTEEKSLSAQHSDFSQRIADSARHAAAAERQVALAEREMQRSEEAVRTAEEALNKAAPASPEAADKSAQAITDLIIAKDRERLQLAASKKQAEASELQLHRSQQDLQAAEAELAVAEAMLRSREDQLQRALHTLKETTGMTQVGENDPVLNPDESAPQLEQAEKDLRALEQQCRTSDEKTAWYQQKYQELTDLCQPFKTNEPDSPFQWADSAQLSLPAWQKELEESKTQQSQVLSLEERIRLLREQHVTFTNKADQIRNLELASADKMAVVQRLRTLADAFDKGSISRSYLSDVYNSVLSAMNVFLNQMGAPFEVRPSDKLFAFEFKRTDEESEWMSQSKLSGGQKVRASVAFLLATQSLVIPQVGLLVMDEPSMHLDQAAQEGMRDLLQDMSAQLRASDKQVIISDHCPVFRPAFDTCVVI